MNNFEKHKCELESALDEKDEEGFSICKRIRKLRGVNPDCSGEFCSTCERENWEWLLAEYKEPKVVDMIKNEQEFEKHKAKLNKVDKALFKGYCDGLEEGESIINNIFWHLINEDFIEHMPTIKKIVEELFEMLTDNYQRTSIICQNSSLEGLQRGEK